MASVATYLSHLILDKVFGRTDFTPAATLYLHLFSVAPNSDGSGGTELTGSNYAAVAITNNTTNFPNASARQKLNGALITLPTAGSTNWLPAVAFKLTDNAVGGNVYTFGKISPAVTVRAFQAGRTIAIGKLIQNLT